MKIQKLKNKSNCAMIILLGLTFTIHCANAVVLNYYSPEEKIVNEIIENFFWFIFILSFPLFLIGIIRGLRNKNAGKNFSLSLFVGGFCLYLFVTLFFIIFYCYLFNNYIYFFYPYYFTYIGLIIFLVPIYIFAKISAKILNIDFLFILSLISILTSVFIIKGI
jgi:hypothetical protein